MKKASTLIFALLLASVLAFTVNVPRAHAAAQINIVSHSGWTSSTGAYHISGEVEILGDEAAEYVKITATFYDSDGAVVATDFTYTMLNVLLPGRKSPFEILMTDKEQAAKVHHYSLTVSSFSATSSIPVGLEILSNSSYIDSLGSMHVVGEIKNIAEGNASYVKIYATFYNSTGHVVATSWTYSDPSDLTPGQTASFDIILVFTERVPLVASYALTAESWEYAIVPEFPSALILSLLMLSMLLTVAITKKSLKKT